jgi:hypothetical protein
MRLRAAQQHSHPLAARTSDAKDEPPPLVILADVLNAEEEIQGRLAARQLRAQPPGRLEHVIEVHEHEYAAHIAADLALLIG